MGRCPHDVFFFSFLEGVPRLALGTHLKKHILFAQASLYYRLLTRDILPGVLARLYLSFASAVASVLSTMPNNSPSPPSPSIELPPFALQIDVILLGLFALYVALTLPRSLFRLFRHSELSNGFFLRSGTAAPPPNSLRQLIVSHTPHHDHHSSSAATTKKKPIRLPIALTSLAAVDIMPVDETEENTVESKRRKSYKSQRRAFTIPPRATAAADTKGFWSLRVPMRVLRWMRILHPTLAYALNFRVAPGISFGNLLVFLIYATLMLYASLYRPNPLTNPQLIGYLAISQIPIALVLAGKTNWVGLACGVGYEKV